MTRIDKTKMKGRDGIIGPKPKPPVPEPIGEVKAPTMRMTRTELVDMAIAGGIEVKNQTKAQLIAELEK